MNDKPLDEYLRLQYESMSKEDLVDLLCERRPEGVNLVFAGKAGARKIARRVRPRAQKMVSSLSVGQEEGQAKNLILEGENLQGMVSLYKYHGAVDLILTDPPYNTGNDFRYNDRWDEDPNDPEPGDLVSAEDGSRYSKWMKFMLPRLQMMRALLKPSGVLAICIDHRELFRLGLLLNEVFGEQNRLGIINWQKTYSPKKATHLSTATEYVLVYAKDEERAKTGVLPRDESMDERYDNEDSDPEGDWTGDNAVASEPRKYTVYAIQSPFSGALHYPEGEYAGGKVGKATHHWRVSPAEMKKTLEGWGSKYEQRDLGDGRGKAVVLKGSKVSLGSYDPDKDSIVKDARRKALSVREKKVWPQIFFLDDRTRGTGCGRPRQKRYLKKVAKGKIPWTYWAEDDYEAPFFLGTQSWDHAESGHSQAGLRELDAIVGKGHGFQTVKPLKLFQKIIHLWCPPNGIVLDPFAGSGTTGHAVLALNQEIGADRSFVLIEQGRVEREDRYARTLTADRLRRVITGEWKAGKQEPLGGGFRFAALTQKVDAKAVLAMEREEMIDLLVSSHWDREARNRPLLIKMLHEGYKHLIARDGEGFGYFLLWQGADDITTLDSDVHDEIVLEAKKAGLRPPYNVYARYEVFQSDDVRFYKIPDRVLIHLGVNEARDAFNENGNS